MSEIISREEAGRLGLIHYFTGDPCDRGHVGLRYVGNKRCLACAGVKFKTRCYSVAKMSSAQQALMIGEKRYFTGRPCINGHIGDRFARNHQCVKCRNLKRGVRAKKRRADKRLAKFFLRELITQERTENRRNRERELKTKQRAALQAIIELGIEI